MNINNNTGLGNIIRRVRSLRMAANVLHIGAHPDDEDIGMMSYLSHKHGARVVYWSATRGEGGQTRVNSYTGKSLGVYRTWEAMAAREYDGSEQLFGPFYDYGYCKNHLDAFSRWGEENVVREIVRAIRLVKPAIVISRWRGEPGDLHGHHQAVGHATYSAFEAAGDPLKFPELGDTGLKAWQPLKFYHSTDNSGGDYSAGGALNLFGRLNPDFEKEGILRINSGELDTVTGKTYQQLAWLGYNEYRSQGIGVEPRPGDFYYYFSLHGSSVPVPEKENEFFDGFDPTLAGLSAHLKHAPTGLHHKLLNTASAIDDALEFLCAKQMSQAAERLFAGVDLLREAQGMLDPERGHDEGAIHDYLVEKDKELQRVIAQCLGLELEGLTAEARVTPRQKLHVQCDLWNHMDVVLDNVDFELKTPHDWEVNSSDVYKENNHAGTSFDVTVNGSATASCPYWLTRPRTGYVYVWPPGSPYGRPLDPPKVGVLCRVRMGERELVLQAPVLTRNAFAGGYRQLPVTVLPRVSLRAHESQIFLPVVPNAQNLEVKVTVTNHADERVVGAVALDLPDQWTSDPTSIDVSLAKSGDIDTNIFRVQIPAGSAEQTYYLRCIFHADDRSYSDTVSFVRMGMSGPANGVDAFNCVKEANIVSSADIAVRLIQVHVARSQKYAYVPGIHAGLRLALFPFGIEFATLASDSDLTYDDLGKHDVIVVGPNAYLMNAALRDNASRLLRYVEDGGTLIVQYQGYGYEGNDFAPYAFQYHRPHDRVTSAEAPVSILEPEHLLFNSPNTIEQRDFDGWVRDRGLYFFGEWDKRYSALLSCSDEMEDPKHGGLIVCMYGRGNFVYTGYSFFRQLPAGTAGAFRLFANLLSLPMARVQERAQFLRGVDLFSDLDDRALELVAKLMFTRWEDDGSIICTEGEIGDELYLVYSGKVDVLRKGESSEEVIATLGSGACVGEMAIFADVPRNATLRAHGEVALLVINGDQFRSLLEEIPKAAVRLLNMVVKRGSKPPNL